METNERLLLMTEIALRHPGIGKTAMMKITYLMQTLRSVPFGYHFEIYTYGPYCRTVMSDIEYAESIHYIQINSVDYGDGIYGYQINPTDEGRSALSAAVDRDDYTAQTSDILNFFGDMSAKDLELYSTIVFVASSCRANSWDTSMDNICRTVRSIKPHFSMDTIHNGFQNLETHSFLPV